ncbi:hypothetical protein D3C71_1318580 [compost metagenome]
MRTVERIQITKRNEQLVEVIPRIQRLVRNVDDFLKRTAETVSIRHRQLDGYRTRVEERLRPVVPGLGQCVAVGVRAQIGDRNGLAHFVLVLVGCELCHRWLIGLQNRNRHRIRITPETVGIHYGIFHRIEARLVEDLLTPFPLLLNNRRSVRSAVVGYVINGRLSGKNLCRLHRERSLRFRLQINDDSLLHIIHGVLQPKRLCNRS